MDPDQLLHDLIGAILEGDIELAYDHCADLKTWKNGGGYAPVDPRIRTMTQPQEPGRGWLASLA